MAIFPGFLWGAQVQPKCQFDHFRHGLTLELGHDLVVDVERGLAALCWTLLAGLSALFLVWRHGHVSLTKIIALEQ